MEIDEIEQVVARRLIKIRKHTEMNQSEVSAISTFAGKSGHLNQSKISRIEKHPFSASVTDIGAYMVAVGLKPEVFYQILQQVTGVTIATFNKEYLKVKTATQHKIKQHIDRHVEMYERSQSILGGASDAPAFKKLQASLEDAITHIKGLNRKPTIGVLGHYDSGKTAKINTLLGTDCGLTLPESYQPTTSIVTLLMHTADCPATLNERVAVFKRGFMPYMINDEAAVEKYLIAEGNQALLEEAGQHSYGVENKLSEAYIAVVFAESPLLEQMWILDTPGDMNSDDSGDSEKSIVGVEICDGILFMDTMSGFMDKNAIGFFTQVLRMKPPVDPTQPFSHIQIYASKAHGVTENDMEQLKSRVAFKNENLFNELLFKHWYEDFNRDGKAYDLEEVNSRVMCGTIMPYAREVPEMRDSSIDRIKGMSDYLAKNHFEIIELAANKVQDDMLRLFNHGIASTGKLKGDIQQRQAEADEIAKILKGAYSKAEKSLNAILRNDIPSYRDKVKKDMTQLENGLTNQSYIVEIIKDNYSSKKEALNGIGDYLGQRISSEFESSLKETSSAFSDKVMLIIQNFESDLKVSSELDFGEINLDLDVQSAFLGGLAGLGSFGAMSAYASAVAAGSNLGAYILTAKLGGILTTLGLASSPVAVTTAVAALGGPIVIGIVIAGIIGAFVWKLAGKSWEEALAEKVVKHLKKNSFMDELNPNITDYWAGTAVALKACMESLKQQVEEDVDKAYRDAKGKHSEEQVNIWLSTLEQGKSAVSGL